jgi:hypothetical protein
VEAATAVLDDAARAGAAQDAATAATAMQAVLVGFARELHDALASAVTGASPA